MEGFVNIVQNMVLSFVGGVFINRCWAHGFRGGQCSPLLASEQQWRNLCKDQPPFDMHWVPLCKMKATRASNLGGAAEYDRQRHESLVLRHLQWAFCRQALRRWEFQVNKLSRFRVPEGDRACSDRSS